MPAAKAVEEALSKAKATRKKAASK